MTETKFIMSTASNDPIPGPYMYTATKLPMDKPLVAMEAPGMTSSVTVAKGDVDAATCNLGQHCEKISLPANAAILGELHQHLPAGDNQGLHAVGDRQKELDQTTSLPRKPGATNKQGLSSSPGHKYTLSTPAMVNTQNATGIMPMPITSFETVLKEIKSSSHRESASSVKLSRVDKLMPSARSSAAQSSVDSVQCDSCPESGNTIPASPVVNTSTHQSNMINICTLDNVINSEAVSVIASNKTDNSGSKLSFSDQSHDGHVLCAKRKLSSDRNHGDEGCKLHIMSRPDSVDPDKLPLTTAEQIVVIPNALGKTSDKYAIPMYLILNRNNASGNSSINLKLEDTEYGVNISIQKPKQDDDITLTSAGTGSTTVVQNVRVNETKRDETLQTKAEGKACKISTSLPKSMDAHCKLGIGGNNLVATAIESLVKADVQVKSPSAAPGQMEESNEVSSTGIQNTKPAKCSRAKKTETLKFPPCVICGGEASGLHYGCNTCEACKNFFRRCLLRKNGVTFYCAHDKKCEISYKKNKTNCSYCRFNKCQALGMSKDKCKMGRYTYIRRTEAINQVRKLQGKDSSHCTGACRSPLPSETSTSPDSSMETDTPDSGEPASNKPPTDGFLGHLESTPRTVIAATTPGPSTSRVASPDLPSTSATGTDTDTDAAVFDINILDDCEASDAVVQRLVDEMDKIRPWGNMDVSDELVETMCAEHYANYMLKVNLFGPLGGISMEEYHTLFKNYGIDIDNTFNDLKSFASEWDTLIRRYCAFAKQIPGFSALCYSDQSALLKSTNSSFFIILMHKAYRPKYNVYLEFNGKPYHLEQVSDTIFTRKLMTRLFDMCERLQNLRLSQSEMALLITIVTMSGDQCKLENTQLVDNVQLKLTQLLQKEMVTGHGRADGTKRFAKFIDFMTEMRDVSLQYFKEYKAMCDNPIIQQEIPNLDVLMPDDI